LSKHQNSPTKSHEVVAFLTNEKKELLPREKKFKKGKKTLDKTKTL